MKNILDIAHKANEEAGSIELHAGKDMDEQEKIAISSEAVCHEGKIAMEHKREETNGEQTENVIETENDVTVRKADAPEHCTQTDEEAGSTVFHVGNDMIEKEMTDSVSGAVCYE